MTDTNNDTVSTPVSPDATVPGWLIPDRVYDVLKWVGLLVCPALATFMLTLGQTWDIPYAPQIAVTITAIGTLVGVVIGASQLKASLPSDKGNDTNK